MVHHGGTLIRNFDGFRRLCRRAAGEFGLPLDLTDADLLLVNRTLAALGGPPAAAEVRGSLSEDGLPLLLLFLLTQPIPCRVGLVGLTEAPMARLKSLVHLLAHAVMPTITGDGPPPYGEVVRELGPGGAALRPVVQYDPAGEPAGILPAGAAGVLRTGIEGGPCTLAVLVGPGCGPVPLDSGGAGLHPTVLILP